MRKLHTYAPATLAAALLIAPPAIPLVAYKIAGIAAVNGVVVDDALIGFGIYAAVILVLAFATISVGFVTRLLAEGYTGSRPTFVRHAHAVKAGI